MPDFFQQLQGKGVFRGDFIFDWLLSPETQYHPEQ